MTAETERVEILDREECLRLLRSTAVGRIVFTANALPAVQPVNYTVDGGAIVIRTESTSKLAVAGRRDIVAFELDDIDPLSGAGWSVVVTGQASEVVAPVDIARVAALPLRSWVPDGAGRYVRISCDIVTGRRIPAATD